MRRAFFLNKIPLRYLIPALLTVFAAVIFLYTLQVYVPIVNSQLERDELEEITQELAFLQRHFERELLKGEVEEVQQEVSSIGANPSREFALLLDENDLVIAATRISWVGQKVDEILPGVIDRNEFGKARDNYQGSMVFSDDREKLTGYYPVGLGAAENELRPSRVGILLMRHDLSPEKAVLKRNVERHLFQRVHVGHAVEEGNDQVEARLEGALEAAEPLDDPCALLRDDAHALDHEGDHHADEQDPEPVSRERRND